MNDLPDTPKLTPGCQGTIGARGLDDELRGLLESVPVQLVCYGRDLRCRFSNATYAGWFGLSPAEIVGMHLRDVVGDAIFTEVEPYVRRAFAGEKVRYLRTKRADDGETTILEATVSPCVTSDGSIDGVFGIVTDVTDVRRAQDIARSSQERLERALESSQLALFEVQVDTGRVYLSEGWAKMIGASPGETQTSIAELLDRVHPDERDALWSHAIDAISGKTQGYDVEHRVHCPDGRWIWILSRSRVVERDAEGRTLRMSGTNVDITERKHAEQRLHYLATRDTLTDLCNRALFGDSLQSAIENASRDHTGVALMSIGLDRFTTINDSLGQNIGDAILKCVAERLTTAAGSEAIVGRPGGDEFLVLLPRVGSSGEAALAAERIHAAISQPAAVDGHELVISASIGIALYPEDADSSGLLLRNADIALHSAKDAGRDTVHFFANRMNVAARSRLDTEAAIRRGLERDEFIVHYQPQVDLATGVIVGFEALVRWQHPQRGLVPPDEFLPVAESTGLIVALGERVLRTACLDAAQWQRRMRAPVPVAVNVTARQFRHRGFVDAVKNALATSNLEPGLLELEIIENAIMEHGPDTVANLDAISAMGVQLAIDDFGTGYSNLGYLKRLPVDTVKIDRSFVADLPGAEDANAIVGAIVALAHNLGLTVVAEGVETRAQYTSLRDHGCDRAQGYYFGRPAPPERLTIAGNDDVFVRHARPA